MRAVRSRMARTTADVTSPVGRLHQLVDAFGLDTVLLTTVDVQGRLKGKAYEARTLVERLRSGRISPEMCGYVIGTDLGMAAPQTGAFSWQTGFGDVALLPDLQRARVLPWLPGTAVVFADPTSEGWPHPLGPVTALNEQRNRLAGLGLTAALGIETEFVLYEGTTRDAAATAGWRRLRPATWDNRDYALDQPGAVAEFGRRLRQVLAEAGLPVEAVKLEGAPGQTEVTFPYGEPLAMCEQHVLFKHAAKAVADERGMAASFMAALPGGVGSGMHLHVSLHSDRGPVLGTGAGAGKELSELGEQAVAGLLTVLPVTAPLWAPYVNSYKRLREHSFAPDRFTWGRDNRSCAVRVVGHDSSLRLEVRLPGADANPVLAMAAVLAGIRHGIAAGLKPPPVSTGDAYQDHHARPVPRSLAEALAAFESSTLAAELLGERVVTHLASVAHLDLEHHAARVTDAELERGFAQA
ncbi:glutamine synthetase family protein [Kitasatospora sp. NBC_00085]|uniref:glutamine synthetase family protein n=1 Tax=Kitasatospora sp. NBC_00085 TaxID=2903566 RepID=UPI003253B597